MEIQAGTVQPITYEVEGGLRVTDYTNKKVTTIYSLKETTLNQDLSAHQIKINGKKIVCPISSKPLEDKGIIFLNTQYMTFKYTKQKFIKIVAEKHQKITNALITNNDYKKTETYYVDPSKDIEGFAYDAYLHKPREITFEEAGKKIKSIKTDFPNFQPKFAVYNRHGVGVIGWENLEGKHSFYWSSPHQKKTQEENKLQKMECQFCDIEIDGNTKDVKRMFAKTLNKNINFQSNGKVYCLNAEPAKMIPCVITFESANEKIKALKENNKNFTIYDAYYNNHGILAYGWESVQNQKISGNYALYFSKPDGEKLEKLESEIYVYRASGDVFGKSRDESVCFEYIHKAKECFFNKEPTIKIELSEKKSS